MRDDEAVSGPRSYSSGTERALFRLARGTCYFPDCREPILKFVEGRPIANAEIAHICGAKEGSARYVHDMTDPQRAGFDNLVLLCGPHHKLVDRVAPADYPADTLRRWKADSETEGGLEDLRLLDLSADGSFEQLIESVVAKLAPARTVAVELKAGILLPGGAAATGPFEALALIARANDHLHHHPRVAIVTVRNVGFVDVAVDAITLHHSVRIPASSNEVVTAMMGRNDYPDLNPRLPSRVVAGESLHWLSSFETLSMMAAGVAPAAIVSIYASVDLGSGERLESNRVSWTDVDLAC